MLECNEEEHTLEGFESAAVECNQECECRRILKLKWRPLGDTGNNYFVTKND